MSVRLAPPGVVAALAGAAVALVVLWMISSAGASAPQASGRCAAEWRVFARSPATPSFVDVAARSASDVWAVGETQSGSLSQAAIVHWDGRSLRVFRPFRAGIHLRAVAAVSSSDVWVIGSRGAEEGQPLIVHWDGAAWKIASLPSLRAGAHLQAVKAISRDDVWAVGWSGKTTPTTLPLVLHWDGRRWRSLDTRALTPRWRRTLLPSDLYAIDATAADNVWVAGDTDLNDYHVEAFVGFAARWNGRRWRYYDWGGDWNGIAPVRVAGKDDVWMLGSAPDGGLALMHWNGHWLRSVHLIEHYTEDVAVLSPRDVWLVGGTSPGNADNIPLVSHWDGRAMRAVAGPFRRLRGATLTSISAVSASEIWAVGNHLIARYSC